MESLAYFVGVMVLSMFALTGASLVLSILVALKKIPKLVGYIAVGLQATLSFFALEIRAEFGYIYLVILAICIVLVFVDLKKSKQ